MNPNSIPRSPKDTVEGLVYFARMLHKIRLHAKGELPQDYIPNLGIGFDEATLKFLHVSYADVQREALAQSTDEAVLHWCFENGHKPSAEEIQTWNETMRNRGRNDEMSSRLAQRKVESGFADRADIQSFFDYIDADEGRL